MTKQAEKDSLFSVSMRGRKEGHEDSFDGSSEVRDDSTKLVAMPICPSRHFIFLYSLRETGCIASAVETMPS